MNEQTIFAEALDRPDPQDRAAFLHQVCQGDSNLRQRVERLLAQHQHAGEFLESPPVATSVMDQPPGREATSTVIGPYKLLEKIGEGGMGTVWMAQQTEPVKRVVALKLIKAGMDSQQVIARFEAERQALALMDHGNIARVLDAGTTDSGRPYFVMDLVRGVPITQYCDEHHLTPRQRLELFVPVCQAIQHAHQKGIIHRDLKPSNVLVALYDGKPVPKVIDFGVAKAAGQSLTDKTLVTGFGAIVGTLEYMSPEQAEVNQLDIDTRSDIYSLGVLLYELLTGSPPFSRKDLEKAGMLEMLRVIREEEPSKPSTKLSSSDALPSLSASRGTEPAKLTKLVRGELDWIVMKALEKDRNRRYETANGFAADLQRYLNDEQVQACPPSAGYRLSKFVRRNRRALATGIVLAVALLAIVGAFGWALRDRRAIAEAVARERGEREAALQVEIKQALEEAEELQRQDEWPRALSAAQRAHGLLAAGGNDELRERARLLRRDLEFVLRLDDVRLLLSEVGKDGQFDGKSASQAYGKVFRENGIDAEGLPLAVAADRIRARAGVTVALVSALDSWASLHRAKDQKTSVALSALAQAADPDPWRRQVREAVRLKSVKSLVSLAAAPEVARQPPTSLMVLANALSAVGLADARIDLLRRAQQQYPGDFWINLSLANDLAESDESISFYRVAVAVRPKCAAAHYSLAHQLTGDEAVVGYRKAIELNPRYANAHCNLGIDLMALGRVDEAIASFRDALSSEPNHVLAMYTLGSALRLQKRLPEALVHLQRAVELAPQWGMAHHELANAFLNQDRIEEAISSYRQAIALNPASDGAHYAVAGALRAQGKVDEAIASYHKAIELNPKHAKALTNLGNILLSLNRDGEAIACYQRAREHDPKLVQPRLNLGNVLCQQRKFAEAAAAYREAVELDPKNALAHACLGYVLREERKLTEAITSLERAIDLDANLASAHAHLGFAFYLQGKLDEAIACYRAALRLEPGRVETHTDLGRALTRNGQPEQALASYRKAVNLDPKNAAAHYYLAWELTVCSERKLRDPDLALEAAQRAVQLEPGTRMYWQGLGYAEHRSGNWKAAVRAFEKVKELGSPGDSLEWFPLAMAKWQLGDKDAARKTYDQAVEWMIANKPHDEFLRGLQIEAAELLGIPLENK